MPYGQEMRITGKIVRDGVKARTAGKYELAEFSVCVGQQVPKGQKRENGDYLFYRVTCWHSMRDWALANLKGGQHVRVVGRFSIRKWTAKDGMERQDMCISADQCFALDDDGNELDSFGDEPKPYRGKSDPDAPRAIPSSGVSSQRKKHDTPAVMEFATPGEASASGLDADQIPF